MKIHTATKKITYQGLDAFLPVLIEQDIDSKTDRTIKRVHISTEDPLANKKTALKYANAWRNELLSNQ
jgi:hypothetical protein|tara:strand:- start:579 stop:782 length:204 start_codon:yes stop_codon:yes gene_type:complete